MNKDNLRKHAPCAKFVCIALIPNWELQFNYFSFNYNGGCTGIEPAITKLVRGAVYEIPPGEMEHLDTVEGVSQGIYYRNLIMVVSETGKPMLAHVYRQVILEDHINQLKNISNIFARAKALGLPKKYIESITTETID
jgi:gamma-glutamylcyclotransferase (GGCT)/AIG2-like uncharacterized protein YtfP